MADHSGLPTKDQEKSMKDMRKCQRKGGWHGLWATLMGGAVTYGGLMSLSRELVPKMYIPMISLGCASCCGWMVSIWVTKTCRLNQLQSFHDHNLQSDGRSKEESIPTEQQKRNPVKNMSNKFGDEAFYKEEK